MSNFGTALTKVNDLYFPLIQKQLDGNGVTMDGYTKQCVLNAIGAINTAMNTKGINWSDPQLDQSNVTDTLMRVASLKLNASASPREIYFQIRNTSVKTRDENNKEVTVWKKQIEMGIEGDGNDSMLARFGRDIKKVGQFWLVREGDEFEYPQYTGFDVTPPKWVPKGKGEVIRVVYPVLKTDGTVEFYIAERDDVLRNILAHISNNMMNETFGICTDRYKATPEQKGQIAEKKAVLMKKARDLGRACLDEPELQKWISPAWTEYQSREAMFIRKMRNNIVKKIPKDFGNAFVEMVYDTSTDGTAARVHKEIAENANQEIIDLSSEDVPETDPVPEQNKPEDPPTQPAQDDKTTVAQGPIGPEF
jgi:hypothetical protein